MDDLLKDFLAESAENLAQLDQDVVELERDPSNISLLNSIFRAIHTIKGTCGFLGLPRLEAVSHTTESVLESLRNGSLTAEPDVISDILRSVDVIKRILADLATNEQEPVGDDTLLIALLEQWLAPRVAAPRGLHVDTFDTSPSGESTQSRVQATTGQVNQSDPARSNSLAADTSSSANGSLRVSIPLLDSLMNLAGELVLNRNQLLEMASREEDSAFSPPVQQLNRITAELQNAIMKTRMQPVGSAWGKLPRIVRDIARETGKKIELDMKGSATEMDRQLVHALQDPLTHMIRNSADHGIETPDQRCALGKPASGTITLNAYHEGGHVIVEITDDGKGISASEVRQKAIERGLVRQDVAGAMSDAQALRLIFEPGFSTATSVTHLSGRGVGMDVVRSNIERVGGAVEISSAPGRGCTVRIRLPLTLAIISSLIVSARDELFAFPQASVLELIRLSGDAAARFDVLHNVRLFRLRNELVPVVTLASVLELTGAGEADVPTLVICQAGTSRFGIVVDDVVDTQEIVVKPIGRHARSLRCYAGCTILGDGRVVMIVDPASLAVRAGTETSSTSVTAAPAAAAAAAARSDSLLLFGVGPDAVQAVRLSLVARLEDIPYERLENAGGTRMVQYRGTLLPIVPASASVTFTAGRSNSVIVFNEGSASFGLAVSEIRDIVEEVVKLEVPSTRPGVLGTAVIAGAATDVLDVAYFMNQARGPQRS
ncbi:MAG: chemotaxis protein CheA [Gemmatimonadota bacterium]|nr:chemotaxis protein CheA [Gemmatimonadota bacterium]